MKAIISVVLLLIFISGCAPNKPKPADKDQRPSLMVRTQIKPMSAPKYNLKLGVVTMRDQRLSNFYGESDNFFRENVISGLSQSAYLLLKKSNLFTETKRIVVNMADTLTRAELKSLAEKNSVDVLFVGDIVTFNLLRKSMMKADGLELKMSGGQSEADVLFNDFQLSVNYKLIGQLIYAKDGSILWAEKIQRNKSVFAEDGTIEVAKLGDITQQVIRDTMADMYTLIDTTALRMKR
jgi:PBP1b-binding outer membrane lipoprotein LpoB